MTDKKDMTTKQFLKRFDEVVSEKGFVGAAEYFDVKQDFVRKVHKGQALPGPKILKKMKLKPVKTINYRYEVL